MKVRNNIFIIIYTVFVFVVTCTRREEIILSVIRFRDEIANEITRI